MRHFAACLLAVALARSPAGAHAILVDSAPASGAVLHPGPVDFALRYNSRIDALRSRLMLADPAGDWTVLPIEPDEEPDRLRTHATLSPGHFVLRWLVLAIDGHITRGDLPFDVAP